MILDILSAGAVHMSIFDISLSGLYSSQLRLRSNANNIANVSTPGYKRTRVETVDSYTPSGTVSAGSGVRAASVSRIFAQGQFDVTGQGLDLAVGGQGFFRLNDNGNIVFGRSGAFHLDNQGYMVNSSGARLTGYQTDTAGNITSQLGDVRIPATSSAPRATSQVTINANLDATATAPAVAFNAADPTSYNFQTATTVQDSLGVNHTLNVYYTKTATANTWDIHTAVDGNVAAGAQTLQFDTSGALTSPAAGTLSLPPVAPSTGAAPMTMTLNMSATTQFGAASSVNSIAQDGSSGGAALTGVSIDSQGTITARYADGKMATQGRVALATVPNPQDLLVLDGGVFAASAEAGDVIVGGAGDGAFGQIQGGALETSNVNLEEELVGLLQAKRAYEANAKVISTESKTLGSLFKAIA